MGLAACNSVSEECLTQPFAIGHKSCLLKSPGNMIEEATGTVTPAVTFDNVLYSCLQLNLTEARGF